MREPLIFPASRRYRVRRAMPGDHRLFPARPDFAEEHALDGNPLDLSLPEGGLSWTLLRNDRPIGMGFCTPWEGEDWNVFAYLSDLSRSDWAYAAMAARAVFRWLETGLGAKRLTVLVREENAVARHFAERLGFASGGLGTLHGVIVRSMTREV